ncbi:hypothetical protein KI387_001701 [Taxus chinensis]|uniref:DUF7806 domain-containing protein n=1 Tax=Taxus chinensis TaxID=29808 RepID=A0AA38GWQ8_TAXCH|nr:hypothetical protein KI387_001701 [Taxus chinensis]
MGQRRNKKSLAVVGPTLTSILNSDSSHSSIEKGSRKITAVENNGNDNGNDTAPLNDISTTRLRNRGKKSGKENGVEIQADCENPSQRRSRRIQAKTVQGTLGNDNKENVSPCGTPLVSSTVKRKRAAKRRSNLEGSQVRRSKRSRVAGFSRDDVYLRKQLGKECEVKGASGAPQRPLSPGTGADAVETCSNSVPSRPAVNSKLDVHIISDDGGSPNVPGAKDTSLHNCQNNDNEDDGHSSAIIIAEMHEAYSKLHAKYRKFKAGKLDGFEAYIEQQTEKFNTYISVAEGLLEHLRNDNNRLRLEANESTALNRVRLLEHQNAECQSDLLVERSKNLALLKEVKRLERLLSDRKNMNKLAQNTNQQCQDASTQSFPSSEKSVVLQPERHEATVDLSRSGLQRLSKNCTSKEAMVQTEVIKNTVDNFCLQSQVTLEEPENSLICNGPARGMATIFSQADVCAPTQGDKLIPEDTLKGDSSNVGCARETGLFQMILQCTLGLQFSIVTEGDELEVLALHESSGFSFTLKCLSAEDDPKLKKNWQLLYCCVSLGTLRKIAPDWMKEEIVFSIGQVNLFFGRILQVANGQGNDLLAR